MQGELVGPLRMQFAGVNWQSSARIEPRSLRALAGSRVSEIVRGARSARTYKGGAHMSQRAFSLGTLSFLCGAAVLGLAAPARAQYSGGHGGVSHYHIDYGATSRSRIVVRPAQPDRASAISFPTSLGN